MQTEYYKLYMQWRFFKGVHANQKSHALYTVVVFTIYTLVDFLWEPTQTLKVTISDPWWGSFLKLQTQDIVLCTHW